MLLIFKLLSFYSCPVNTRSSRMSVYTHFRQFEIKSSLKRCVTGVDRVCGITFFQVFQVRHPGRRTNAGCFECLVSDAFEIGFVFLDRKRQRYLGYIPKKDNPPGWASDGSTENKTAPPLFISRHGGLAGQPYTY